MRTVALTNYNGNASANTLSPVTDAFTLHVRCDDQNIVPAGGANRSTMESLELETVGAAGPGLGCSDIAKATLTAPTLESGGGGAPSSVIPLSLVKKVDRESGVPLLSVTVAPSHSQQAFQTSAAESHGFVHPLKSRRNI